MAYRTNSAREHRKGVALLLVLLAIVVVVVMMSIDMGALFGWDSGGDPFECPWVEKDRLIMDGSDILLPEAPKPTLDETREFRMDVIDEEGERRGFVEFIVSTEGFVYAEWAKDFKVGDVECSYSAGAEGNIDITKTYEDENGNTKPSWLFFIAKGKFTKMGFHKSSRAAAGGGEAWFIGWLKPEGRAQGRMILAFDKKSTEIYELQR